jgi:hypothetical protein
MMPRIPYVALVGVPLAVLALVALVALVRWLLGLGPLGPDDTSLQIAYGLLGAFAIGTLVELVAVPWAVVVLARNPALRSRRAKFAIAFGAAFALAALGVVALTAMYAGGA